MKMMLVPAAMAMAFGLMVSPIHAQAAGCVKGAVVGGVAGHMAGHHGALGAAGGCAVGHHEASKHADQKQAQNDKSSH